MAVVNTYYDFDDYNSPVKTYFDDQFYYDFVAGFEKETDIYVSQSSVEQKDSYFRYTPKGDEINFINIENVKEKFKKEDSKSKIVMSIKFYKDSKSKSYERQIFALLEVFGNIGGVNEILEIAGELIVGIFAAKIFLFSMISSMYQVDSTNINKTNRSIADDTKSVSTLKIDKNHSDNFHLENDMKIENIDVVEEKKNTRDETFNQYQNLNQQSINQSDLNNDVVKKAAENMKRRYRYNYSIFDLAYNYLMPIKIFFC